MEDFDKLPQPLKRACAWRAFLELLGWSNEAFIVYGAQLINIPVETGLVMPPNATMVSVHLKLGGRHAPDDAVVLGGFLDNDAWPADESVEAAATLWNHLGPGERDEVRQRYITDDEKTKFLAYLTTRGVVPPAIEQVVHLLPKGSN